MTDRACRELKPRIRLPLNRKCGIERMFETGFEDVFNLSFDRDFTVQKFRPVSEHEKKKRKERKIEINGRLLTPDIDRQLKSVI